MKLVKMLPAVLVVFLFACHAQGKDNQAVTVKELVRTNVSWDGKPLPDYPAGTPEISILRITVLPGAQLPTHQHPVINAGVLLSGELTVVTQDDKTLHLQAGDPIVEVIDTWHHGRNEGTLPADIIVFYAGTAGMPLSIKEGR